MILLLLLMNEGITAQLENPATDSQRVTSELRSFFDAYAEDLRKHRREAIANRYDSTGYYRVGNGSKRFFTFQELKARCLTTWMGPLSFDFKDLSFQVLSPESAVVTGLFDIRGSTSTRTFSYSSLLVKRNSGWRILMEDESASPHGYTLEPVSGSPNARLFKYTLKAQPAASVAAHRHSRDMRIKIISGKEFISMGDLEKQYVQQFGAGTSMVIPAGVWHIEWWESETVEVIEIMAPWKTERATPLTPRK